VLDGLRSAGIEARYSFKPMHMQPVFADSPVVGGDVAAGLFERSLSLPSGSTLTGDDVGWICDVVGSARVV
jgi:dTDP-4-amino-4,6-dideoxygalactose transaminase